VFEESISKLNWKDGGKPKMQSDSKLFSEFSWLIIFKPEKIK
jgi:hypothetical protein